MTSDDVTHTPEKDATACLDGLPFDPEPWLTSSMAASAQARWSRTQFRPREAYCQDEAHYPETIYRSGRVTVIPPGSGEGTS